MLFSFAICFITRHHIVVKLNTLAALTYPANAFELLGSPSSKQARNSRQTANKIHPRCSAARNTSRNDGYTQRLAVLCREERARVPAALLPPSRAGGTARSNRQGVAVPASLPYTNHNPGHTRGTWRHRSVRGDGQMQENRGKHQAGRTDHERVALSSCSPPHTLFRRRNLIDLDGGVFELKEYSFKFRLNCGFTLLISECAF